MTMATTTRCRMLAHLIAGFEPKDRVMRCPTTTSSFHYHAATRDYSPLSGRVPCPHRHQSVNAALTCAEKVNP
jgi:hypothetical protein